MAERLRYVIARRSWLAVLLAGASLLTLSACERVYSLGEGIFHEGRGENGRLAYSQGPEWLARGEFGCATCHGVDGSGRFVRAGGAAGSAPPITGKALSARGYDREKLRRALFEGVTSDGKSMNAYMPRWSMSDDEFEALAALLAEL